MKILMLSWEYPPRIIGGISRVVHNLAQKLGELGNEVHIVTCWENGTLEEEFDNSVHVHRVHTCQINANSFINWVLQFNFSLVEKSVKLINGTGRFDVIHAHDWLTAFAAKTLKHIYSIPLISTIHATESGRNYGLHNDVQRYISSVEWWLTYESWIIIVNSRFMKNEVKNIFQLPEDKIRIIPNGVNIDKFRNYSRDNKFRRNYATDNEKIVFFVGRLVNEKGAHVLINAAPKIIRYYNDAKIIIAGKGPQLEYLRKIAYELNIYSKVYFTGYISEEELAKLYKCADVAVFPSLYEPFGIVALEGMLANVPVVVSDTGGLGEIVEHGIDGMKSYTGNSNSLADSILEILLNPKEAEKMKSKAMEKVFSMYNWDVITYHTLNVYKEITGIKITKQ
ncbi:MAG TPA: glycosyltransferase family 4 protein [Clostridiaceae bacterium]|jgi:glycogen(starch) synthase|nr:glycosyltransferase family 4 protein [Clostridiaceae bacterium]